MRTVYLHGHLGEQFGEKHRFEVATAIEAVRALNCAFPGRFVSVLREGSYEVIRGRRIGGMHLDLALMQEFKLGQADLHFVPVAAGAKSGAGAVKAIVGAAIVGAAIFFSGGTLAAPLAGLSGTAFSIGGLGITWGNIAMLGLGVALLGVSTALAQPSGNGSQPSFSFNGPMQLGKQGDVVQVIIGEVITSGAPISVGFNVEDIPLQG